MEKNNKKKIDITNIRLLSIVGIIIIRETIIRMKLEG